MKHGQCARCVELARERDALRDAAEPFIRAAYIIAKRPQDYQNRIVMIGGLEDAHDLTKKHFSDLLASLGAKPCA
jgi:hypothetical protein